MDLGRTNYIKYLDIDIDEAFNWRRHIDIDICFRVRELIFVMKKLRHTADRKIVRYCKISHYF